MEDSQYQKISSQEFLDYIKDKPYIEKYSYLHFKEELFLINIHLESLYFENCIFNKNVTISGNLGSGIYFNSCNIIENISFSKIETEFNHKIDNYNFSSASLIIENSTVNVLTISESKFDRGIIIKNDTAIQRLLINGLNCNNNSLIFISSKILRSCDIFNGEKIKNINFQETEITCLARFHEIIAESFYFLVGKCEKLLISSCRYSKSLSIDKSEIFDTVNFVETNFNQNFNLFDSIFNKEVSISNVNVGHYFIRNCNFKTGFIAQYKEQPIEPSLTLNFSNSLIGNIIFDSTTFKNVILSGHNNSLSLTFDTCKFHIFECNNITNNQTIRLSNCESSIEEGSKLIIKNSNLGKLNLLGTNLSRFKEVTIKSSFISDIQYANIIWFDETSLTGTNEEKMEIYRQLKLAGEKQGDAVSTLRFKSKELLYYQTTLGQPSSLPKTLQNLMTPFRIIFKFLNSFLRSLINFIDPTKTLSDRIILYLGKTTNNFGTNWTKPIFLILITTLLFYIAISISLSNQILWSLDFTNIPQTFVELKLYPSLYFQLLNPAHDLNRILSSNFFSKSVLKEIHWSVFAFDILHRIIYAFLIFQLVVAFRKFVK
jgi:hypothetical protein